ncbi:MAG: GNAT family N-acetyltransferase [Gemmatimonadales bacterium]
MTSGVPLGDAEPSGYAHPSYAASLAEFGTIRPLPESGGHLLERPIPGHPYRDAMGCYPLFACRDWTRLAGDLDAIGRTLVSVALVADPFGPSNPSVLERCFDRVVAFKQHFVVDLGRPMGTGVSSHHRRSAQRALRQVSVEWVDDPPGFAAEWCALYRVLTGRHGIRGLPAFSETALARQLAVPGIAVLRARRDSETLGATLWYRQGEFAYYHLGAYAEAGYHLRVSFALFWTAVESFAAAGLRWLDLGGAAGSQSGGADDGLARFKQGWATDSRTAYLCGRVFDPMAYQHLAAASGVPQTDYFPAYRMGEFA